MLLFVAIMMVSRVPTFSIKRIRVPPDFVLPVLTSAGICLIFLITETWLTLSIVAAAYLASIPVSWFVARRMRLREPAAAAPEATAAAPEPAAAGPTAPTAESAGRPPERVLSFEARPPRT
jgi:CDP-diacylglycerol--serine O-phosphatidyltransferase